MQGKRQNQRPMDDFPVYPDMREEGGGIIQEYAPFVFGGVMLIAAFAFAGNYMGQNASARNLSPDEQTLVSPVTNIIAKGSLLPEGENFDIVNLKVLRKQSVVSLGKGDFFNADPNGDVFISPASVDLSGKSDVVRPDGKAHGIGAFTCQN